MNANELRELIELISRSNFVTFELEREGFKIRLVKAGGRAVSVLAAAAPVLPGTGSDAPVPAAAPKAEPSA